MKRQLILENGEVFIGEGFGADVEKSGEVIFNTGMTGYQEVITDLSNCGQIITMTNPLIGNYGFNRDDFESVHSAIHGLIVKEYEDEPSHWRENRTLGSYLQEKGIPGLAKIDTRKLTRMIRENGTLRGKICGIDEDINAIVQELKETTPLTNEVEIVSTKEIYHAPGKESRVVVVDLGVKHTILEEIIERDCDVVVVPHDTSADAIMQLQPDGVLLSNGPGNPENLSAVIKTVQQLLGQVPVFGIDLGYQVLGLACGAKTCKLPFGHRGANHPVRDLEAGRVVITTQNHGYTIERNSIEGTDLEVTHVSLNDEAVEGIKHKSEKAFGVQFTPGTYDANELYDEFISMMKSVSN